MTVDLSEIARYMRMGRTVPEGELAARVIALRDEAVKVVRPARTWRRFQNNTTIKEDWDQDIEKTMEIIKTKWLDD